ncbi:hypothetical protein AWB69_00031 [Caballeronia udeis]|uniref:Uncharacterized protein n=1 Tax=Caballeronia udeis TaxID=1232866 RepID=A0A158EQP2_9BURK|nr:hypothetical protein [Caballeronia udeis]SAL09409.1 hypothetical protein AWB69_00031 [Caballeronia udeis]
MSNSKRRFKGAKDKRPSGRFYTLPAVVLQSAAFISLSAHAIKLMLDLLEQYRGDDNGRMLCTWAHMHEKRGWKSRDTLDKARAELMTAGFLFETVKGRRPNRASWYALTFFAIDPHDDFDVSLQSFPYLAFADRPKLLLKNASLITPGVSLAA